MKKLRFKAWMELAHISGGSRIHITNTMRFNNLKRQKMQWCFEAKRAP